MLEAAFLQDIVTHPDDDTARLVYADWLEENGDAARAELIRLQCRRAQLADDDALVRSLLVQETRLLADHQDRWRAALPALPGIAWEDFSRGFIVAVRAASPDAFLDSAEAIFRATPVRRLRIVDPFTPGWSAFLADSPYLPRLTELNLGNAGSLRLADVARLLRSPGIENLTSLLLHYCPLGDALLEEVAASAHLARLEELYVSGTGATGRGVEALAGGALSALRALDLRDNQIDETGAVALSRWRASPCLETLYLTNNRVHALGASAFASSRGLRPLRRLYLNYNPLGDDGARAFARSDQLPALRELDLRHCGITDDSGTVLARSPLARRVEKLWLSGNPIRLRETWQALRSELGPRLVG